jgi:hypothetical protein
VPGKPGVGAKVFSREQTIALRTILGDAVAEEVLPRLEGAVLSHREGQGRREIEKRTAYRDEARQHARVSRSIGRQIVKLLKSLDRAEGLLANAEDRDLVSSRSTRTLGGLVDYYKYPPVEPLQTTLENARSALSELARTTAAWEWRARRAAVRKPGRKGQDERLDLAGFVGICLAYFGVPLTKGADGVWAQVTAHVYEAAEIRVPSNMFRDLQAAHAELTGMFPNEPRLTSQRNRQRKARQIP